MERLLAFFSLAGILDAGYLTYEHYFGTSEICPWNNIFFACGRVLDSPYAVIMGIPLALLGLLHYGWLLTLLIVSKNSQSPILKKLILFQATVGFLFSLYLVYLQQAVIQAWCFYCLLSAAISLLIFALAFLDWLRQEPKPKAE